MTIISPNGWVPGYQGHPRAPLNPQVTTPFYTQAFDIRWDDPSEDPLNSCLTVYGVNIYRSAGNDRGPYHRVNEYPVGTNFYRDQTLTRRIVQEVIPYDTGWINRGVSPGIRTWRLRTRHNIAKGVNSAISANSLQDVHVEIDGIPWPAGEVFGLTNEIILADRVLEDPVTEKWVYLPAITSDTVVTVTYYTTENSLKTYTGSTVFYRLTTVASHPDNPTELIETPLELCKPVSSIEVETLNYIWKEAKRRNLWILQQAGERVKLFVRKTFGQFCTCAMDRRTRVYTGQPSQRCTLCFGTGIRGGYEGPYEIIIGPEDAERKISQTPQGRRLEMMYEVWTTPYPLITQRDFVVKQTNERFSIGPVRRPSERGNYLQQHFQIGFLDSGDIRYQVPVTGTNELAWPEVRLTDSTLYTGEPGQNKHDPESQPFPIGPDAATPMETDSPLIPNVREERGRTPVWMNVQNGGRGT